MTAASVAYIYNKNSPLLEAEAVIAGAEPTAAAIEHIDQRTRVEVVEKEFRSFARETL